MLAFQWRFSLPPCSLNVAEDSVSESSGTGPDRDETPNLAGDHRGAWPCQCSFQPETAAPAESEGSGEGVSHETSAFPESADALPPLSDCSKLDGADDGEDNDEGSQDWPSTGAPDTEEDTDS